jgi:hypothetical protein
MTFQKKSNISKLRPRENGNVFVLIFVAIALLGALTWAVSYSTQQQTSLSSNAEIDSQIAILMAQGSALSGAVQQMIVNGAEPSQLPTSDATYGLSTLTPGAVGWDIAPNTLKIYHPYGGGIKYETQTGTGAVLSNTANLANNFKISKGSIVKGVGPTDTVGDMVFTAAVASLAACQRINQLVRGTAATATPPTMTDIAYTAMIVNGTDTTLDDTTGGSGTCATCINIAQSCVRNTSANAWGYYQVLYPQ